MTIATVVDVAVNPNDQAQRYILWGNGRIDAIGGAPAITAGPPQVWFSRFDPPAVALHISDWTTGAGYVLDYRGGFNPINGAPDLGTAATSGLKAGVPEVPGVPVSSSPREALYVDWSWDPNGSGRAVVLDTYGQLYPYNGANPPTRSGRLWGHAGAPRRLAVQWSGGQPTGAAILDFAGGIHGNYGTPLYPHTLFWPGWSAARDFVVTDWTNFSGYVLDLYGGLNSFGTGTDKPHGYPYKKGADVARCMVLLSAADPLEFLEVWSNGQQYQFVSSTPPTVTAGGLDPVSPAATVTDTSRPVLAWSYDDAEADHQAVWEVLLFTKSFTTSHTMTDPMAWQAEALTYLTGIDRAQRGVVPPLDLGNGDYVVYVRAQDSSGLWSAWSSLTWTQNVPAPVTPSGLTATADQDTYSVALSVTADTTGSADFIRFECSDDDGFTWAPVRGADRVPIASPATATDLDIPLGGTRLYRAIAFADSPRVASAPSLSATATMTPQHHVLTAVNDATLGGRVLAQEPIEWTWTAKAGVFEGIGADYVTVVSDGTPKGRKATIHLVSMTQATWEMVNALVRSRSTLVYRTPLGEVVYCRVVGDFTRAALKGAATRHETSVDLPLVEVAPPSTPVTTSPPLGG